MKLTLALCQRGVVGLTILFSEFRQGTGAEMRPVVVGSSPATCRSAIRESSVKQQRRRRRRRRLRKRHLEVNLRFFELYRAYSILSNIGNFFLELSSRGLYQSSGKEKKSCCLVFPSSTGKQEARRSRAETAKKCTKKRVARAELLFANLNLLLFCRSRWRRRRRCLSSLLASLLDVSNSPRCLCES